MGTLAFNDRVTAEVTAIEGQTDFAADFPLLSEEAGGFSHIFVSRIRDEQADILSFADFEVVGETTGAFTLRLYAPSDEGDRVQIYSTIPPERERRHVPGGAVRTPTLEADAVSLQAQLQEQARRSEERRVGKECRRLCRSRWSPYH
jgi:hypothetical protein